MANFKSFKTTMTTTTTTTTTAIAFKMVHALLAFQLLLALSALTTSQNGNGAHALPITSKPIESTAENLAWQAWLMLPPEQKSQEKSRKVTPKSIFTLPFRECPPDHQMFQSRCIPTVNIDQNMLLAQQFVGLIAGGGGAGGGVGGADDDTYGIDYGDYDMDEGGEGVPDSVLYEAPQKMNGAAGMPVEPYDDSAQVPPRQDAPLKFNIFQQKFPTGDYVEGVEGSGNGNGSGAVGGGGNNNNSNSSIAASNGGSENRTESFFNPSQFLEAVNEYLQRHSPNANNMVDVNTYNNSDNNNNNRSDNNSHFVNKSDPADLQTESTNVSTKFVASPPAAAAAASSSGGGQREVFALSDIDAIVLPAAITGHGQGNAHVDLEPGHAAAGHRNRISLFKDDSAVQLVTGAVSPDRRFYEEPSAQPDMSQLLRADALLPLPGIAEFERADEMPQAALWTQNNHRLSEPSGGGGAAESAIEGGGPMYMPMAPLAPITDTDEATTGMAMLADDAAAAAGATATEPKLQQSNSPKEEYPRSVTDAQSEDEMRGQEEWFTTTMEPEGTTNFQLDETTIIETGDEPAAASAQSERNESHHADEKSKVEPVEWVAMTTTAPTEESKLVTAKTVATEQTQTTTTTAKTTTTKSTPLPSDDHDDDASTAATASTVPAPSTTITTTTTTTTAEFPTKSTDAETAAEPPPPPPSPEAQPQTDRFNEQKQQQQQQQQEEKQQAGMDGNQRRRGSDGIVVGHADNPANVRTAGEIDMERELRIINELVKGKRQMAIVAAAAPAASATKPKATTAKKSTESTKSPITTQESSPARRSNSVTQEGEPEAAAVTTETTTTTTIPKVMAPTSVSMAMNKESVAVNPVEEKNADETAEMSEVTASTTPSTTTTTTTAATIEAGGTIWSKIMPILGFGSAATESTPTPTTTTSQSEISSQNSRGGTSPDASSGSSDSVSGSGSRSILSGSPSDSLISLRTSNRSNRNSKIIRMNDFDAKTSSSSSSSSSPATATVEESTLKTPTNDESGFDPFWWLPTGWRLDRHQEAEDQNLLLRFWSTFPESQTKVQRP